MHNRFPSCPYTTFLVSWKRFYKIYLVLLACCFSFCFGRLIPTRYFCLHSAAAWVSSISYIMTADFFEIFIWIQQNYLYHLVFCYNRPLYACRFNGRSKHNNHFSLSRFFLNIMMDYFFLIFRRVKAPKYYYRGCKNFISSFRWVVCGFELFVDRNFVSYLFDHCFQKFKTVLTTHLLNLFPKKTKNQFQILKIPNRNRYCVFFEKT